jgi:hypothetical protein
MLRKFGIIAVLSLIAVAVAAVPALAVNPTNITQSGGLHFVGTPTVTATKSGQTAFLTSNFEVAGAGTTANAVLSADAVATVGCINRGSKDQEPSGLQTTTQPVIGSGSFATRQGRSGPQKVSTSAATIPSTFTCPDQMTPTLVSVTFTNVKLTVTSQTGTTTAFFPDIDP